MRRSVRASVSVSPGPLVTGDILHAEFAEHVAAAPQFFIDTLKHAQCELAVALDRDDLGMGRCLVRSI